MSNAGATIGTLNQALRCAGKCDCCDKLQSQINGLNQRINALEGKFIPRSEKPQIINESVSKANGFTINFVNSEIAPVKGELNLLKVLVDGLIIAIEIIKASIRVLENLFNSLAELLNLPGRVQRLENRVSGIEQELSRFLGLLNQIKGVAERALQVANEALNIGQRALELSLLAKNLSEKALAEIKSLTQNILAALRRLEAFINSEIARLSIQIGDLRRIVNEIINRIGEIISRLFRLENVIALLSGRVNVLELIAKNLYGLVFQALMEVGILELRLDQTIFRIGILEAAIRAIRTTANEAINKANEALRKANEALAKKAIPGPAGIPGLQGIPGIQGIPGPQGIPGRNGVNGRNGIDGMTPEDKAQLDRLENLAKLIPVLLASPKPLSYSETINASAAGTCKSFQPGGCASNSVQNNLNNSFNIGSPLANTLSNLFNTGANAAQLALLQKIDLKLGAQIVGGISGKLVQGFKWLQLDRALNILTFAATVHNAAMLSNDILQTLVGAFTNVLSLIVPKDDSGNTFNVGQAINSTVENTVKGIIGAENYTNLSNTWAKANRIYQATTNVLNSFLSLTQTVLQAAEMIAAYTGKIGNALRKGGVVLENAYGWMNPQPKFNRVAQSLENLQQASSTVQMVTQVPLDVINATTEFNNSATEFVKAVKEDDKPANRATPVPEPDELKAKETQAKTDSQPASFDFSDLFDGED